MNIKPKATLISASELLVHDLILDSSGDRHRMVEAINTSKYGETLAVSVSEAHQSPYVLYLEPTDTLMILKREQLIED